MEVAAFPDPNASVTGTEALPTPSATVTSPMEIDGGLSFASSVMVYVVDSPVTCSARSLTSTAMNSAFSSIESPLSAIVVSVIGVSEAVPAGMVPIVAPAV